MTEPTVVVFDPHVAMAIAALGLALVALILILVWNAADRPANDPGLTDAREFCS
jgi:hypothetical protein